jgi:hypothetical protein
MWPLLQTMADLKDAVNEGERRTTVLGRRLDFPSWPTPSIEAGRGSGSKRSAGVFHHNRPKAGFPIDADMREYKSGRASA